MTFPSFAAFTAGLAAALLAACNSAPLGRPAPLARENFDSAATHSRSFAAAAAQTCEAARRALLSQGYVTSIASADLVTARKNFQPSEEVHVEVEFRVVCTPAAANGATSIAFVSALQDRYALKKVNNSASLGVGVLGSVSLPFSSSDDALVKVASETLTGSNFYDQFFRLIERYLPADAGRTGHADPAAGSTSKPADIVETPDIADPAHTADAAASAASAAR